jgi:hypothetical protein
MTKDQTQITVIIIGVMVIAAIVANNMKSKKIKKPVAQTEAASVVIDSGVKVTAKLPAVDSNVLENQKKRAEAPWGRDPFSSDTYKSGQVSSELKLQGISYRKDNVGFAFINNEIVKQGDAIAGYEVEEVLKDKVLLKKGSQSFYLTFPAE